MKCFKSILKGVLIAYIISIFCILLFSMLLVKTNIKEQYINIVIIVISSISILIGTTLSTIKTKKYGIINGILISTIYMLILYFISSLFNGNYGVTQSLVMFLICSIVLGVFGGIIGVNIKS